MTLGMVDGYIVVVPDGGEATITVADGTGDFTTPRLVLGYETSREGRNVVHDLIGGGIGVALVAPRPRSGVLSLLYLTEGEAWAASALHAREAPFVFVSATRPGVGMTYIVAGNLGVELDAETRRRWVVKVPYQEV